MASPGWRMRARAAASVFVLVWWIVLAALAVATAAHDHHDDGLYDPACQLLPLGALVAEGTVGHHGDGVVVLATLTAPIAAPAVSPPPPPGGCDWPRAPPSA